MSLKAQLPPVKDETTFETCASQMGKSSPPPPPPPPQRVLSDYAPKKKESPNLMDTLRQLLPKTPQAGKMPTTGGAVNPKVDHCDDVAAKIRVTKTAKPPTIQVFRSKMPVAEHSTPIPSEGASRGSVSLQSRRSEDHYSPSEHLKHLVSELGVAIDEQTLASIQRETRTHRAKTFFSVANLGTDEAVFEEQMLQKQLKAYVPEELLAGGGSMSMAPARNGSKCCSSLSNCGTCFVLKAFVVATQLVALLMYLSDPCYPVKQWFVGGSKHSTTTHLPMGFHLQMDDTLGADNGNGAHLNLTVTQPPLRDSKLARSGRLRLSSHRLASGHGASENCSYKTFYIALLGVGMCLYSVVCLVYTCQLVVRFHNVPWFLLEATFLLLYSFVLFGSSIAGFVLKGELESTVLGFIDALIGIGVGLWAYGNHRFGITPLESITTDDADQNMVARMLGYKQIAKFFAKDDNAGKLADPEPEEPLERL